MKKLLKKVVTGVLAASMMLSSVVVSYGMPLWDSATNTSNLWFSNDATGKTTVDMGYGEMPVYILPEDGSFWFDSSKSKISKADMEHVRFSVDLDKASGYSDRAKAIPAEFDKKYNFFKGDFVLPWTEVDEVRGKPHVFIVTAYGNDESWVETRFSYYQGFDNVTTLKYSESKAPETIWKNDSNGWWVERSDGSYLKNEWYQSESGLYYYLGADGYMLTDTTTPDGYTANADGVWVQ